MGQRISAEAEQLTLSLGPAVDPDAALSLAETTFVVVDLETTGGRAAAKRRASATTPSPRSVR
ncbi:hypothetical protein BN970_04873 [Mycolicibacterium conceptionense]|uniref:Uncharacterized protein n=1 Tax=Mycolicibacterium conceptionense TaxID=451644 RepID=A0A0U1DQM1_9MYCO|nr:hypothetical protein BN970_04873 [Mycolicibacterium conceptionense]